MADFDRFADDYRAKLDKSLALGGETFEHFVVGKVAYINRSLDRSRARRILDYGCGVGTLLSVLAKSRPADELHGYDVSAESLARVDADVRGRVSLTSSLRDLRSDYDLIILSNVLHHIEPAQRHSTIDDLATRLAAGGSLLVIEHNPLNPLTRWVVAHCEFDDDAVLLWPGEVKNYFTHARLASSKRDYLFFFPKVLAALRSFESLLSWCPAGAQYAIWGTAVR